MGLKIKNKTKQALMSGPVTVYEGEQPYSGDARILDLQPNEERYLSYALDTGVEIKPFDVIARPRDDGPMENGQLNVQYKMRHTRTYVIVNRSPEDRKVVIEQPIKTGWKLVKPEKPTEVTTDLYRFEVNVKAGETAKYRSERRTAADRSVRERPSRPTGPASRRSLGLDVWTGNEQARPEDSFLMQIVNPNSLQVTHKDRKATTYFFKNRADEDRIIWLEHNVVPERKLIGDHEPIDKGGSRYRFKVELKKGQSHTHVVKEELAVARPESVALHTAAGSSTSRPGEDDIPQQRFVTELGFELWQTRNAAPAALVGARFAKGELHTTAREVSNTRLESRVDQT